MHDSHHTGTCGARDLAPLRSFLHFSRVTSLLLQSRGRLRAVLDVRLGATDDHVPEPSTTHVFPPAQLGGVVVTVVASTTNPTAFTRIMADLQHELAAPAPLPTPIDAHKRRALDVCLTFTAATVSHIAALAVQSRHTTAKRRYSHPNTNHQPIP